MLFFSSAVQQSRAYLTGVAQLSLYGMLHVLLWTSLICAVDRDRAHGLRGPPVAANDFHLISKNHKALFQKLTNRYRVTV